MEEEGLLHHIKVRFLLQKYNSNSESFIGTHSTLIEPFLYALYYILSHPCFLQIIT